MELERPTYADRSGRGKLRLTGPQRAWFLHQITTQHFDPLAPGEAREAAMLTVHGRMLGYFEAIETGDAILVHFEPELRDSLPEHLRKYIFATQVEIEDVTEEMGLLLVAGPAWREIADSVAPTAPVQPTHALGAPAGYVWTALDRLSQVIDALASRGARPATEEELEAIRIVNGAPRWGRDMSSKTMPQEANLEGVALHLDKGCYVGQEAVAKIHFRGKVNRRLRHLETSAPLEVGVELTLDGSKVGVITSSHDRHAIGLLRYTIEPGMVVVSGETEAKVLA